MQVCDVSGPFAPVERDPLQRCIRRQPLPTIQGLTSPGIGPGRRRGQVDLPAAGTFVQHRGDEQVRAEHKLVVYSGASLVLREVEEERAHRWDTPLVGHAHLRHYVGPQPLAQEEQLLDDRVGLVAKRPDLIRAAGTLGDRLAISV